MDPRPVGSARARIQALIPSEPTMSRDHYPHSKIQHPLAHHQSAEFPIHRRDLYLRQRRLAEIVDKLWQQKKFHKPSISQMNKKITPRAHLYHTVQTELGLILSIFLHLPHDVQNLHQTLL